MGRTIIDRFKRSRSNWRRLMRLLFPSPAEMRFIELMGGKVWRVEWLTRRDFPLCFVVSRGKLLRQERMHREIRIGSKYVDLGNDIGRVIEIDGAEWHSDIVADFDRDTYLYSRGFRVMRIPAIEIYNSGERVVAKVTKFLTE